MTTLSQHRARAALRWVRVAFVAVCIFLAGARSAAAMPAPPVPSEFHTRTFGAVTASFPANADARVRDLLPQIPRVQQSLARLLGHPLDEPVDLRFVWSPEEMASLAPADAPPPRYATGVSYPAQRVAIVALADARNPSAANAAETLAHELAHVALAEATADAPIPRWFHEGFAIHAAGERSIARYEVLAEAAAFRQLIALESLDAHFADESFDVTLAYAEAADVLRFLSRDGDRLRFVGLLERLRVGQPFDRALSDAYGIDLRKLDYEWRNEAAKRFAFLPIFTGGSVLWVAMAVVFAFGWARKRREAKATMARWEAEEDESRRLAELSRLRLVERDVVEATPVPPQLQPPPQTEDGEAPRVSPSRLVVEHEGRWHTLH
jgi:Peptidase MA superfamily